MRAYTYTCIAGEDKALYTETVLGPVYMEVGDPR